MPRRFTGWEDRDDAQDHQRLRRILHAGGRSGRRAIRAGDLAGHGAGDALGRATRSRDRKSTRLNSSHRCISYAVFCLKKKKKKTTNSYSNKETAQTQRYMTT